MIFLSKHLHLKLHKLSRTFTKGNTRKISRVFLPLRVCDIIKSLKTTCAHTSMPIKGFLVACSTIVKSENLCPIQKTGGNDS